MKRSKGVTVLLVILTSLSLVGCDVIARSNFKAAKGVALYNNGRYSEAVTPLEEAIEIRAEHGKAHYYLALTYMELGGEERATNLLKSYLGRVTQTKAWMGEIDKEYIPKCKELLSKQSSQ